MQGIIDDFSRECLGAVVDTSISGKCVARELDRIAEARGSPKVFLSAVALAAIAMFWL